MSSLGWIPGIRGDDKRLGTLQLKWIVSTQELWGGLISFILK